MGLSIKSSAFDDGQFIPDKHTCLGEDISPPLSWEEVPEGTKSFTLICDDPDAVGGTWVHWVMYDIPADKKSLPEGVKPDDVLDDGSKQGITDFGRPGYGGPGAPPGRVHRYFFKLYALDTMLDLAPRISSKQLRDAMQNHIIEKTELIGKFQR